MRPFVLACALVLAACGGSPLSSNASSVREPMSEVGVGDELVLMHWNVDFLWDGVAPEDGEADLDFPWRGSPEKADAHMAEIAETIRKVDADLVNLAEVEDQRALDTFVERHLAGMGYHAYLVDGTDTATGQDMALLSRLPAETFGRDPRRGRSGGTRKGVSKHYVATLDVPTSSGTKKLGLIGLHLLAGPTRKNRVEPREAQADAIRGMARELAGQGRSLVVWGDFNDFDGAIADAKRSKPITRVLEWVREVDPRNTSDDLTNVIERVPRDQRYTSRGRFKNAIDHVLVSPDLAGSITKVEVLHRARGSGHSPIVVSLAL